MGLLVKALVATLPFVPGPFMRRVAARYIAGDSLDEALAALAALQKEGHPGILDLLGENVAGEADARAALAEYRAASDALKGRSIDAYLSVKPTHFGLGTSRELALELYRDLARHTAGRGQHVRVEMEDHTRTDDTLWLYAALRAEFPHVGIVLQSRLKRTPEDIRALPPDSDVRLCKGIYVEPPEVAHTDYVPIRDAYVGACEALWRAGHRIRLATHDEHMAARCIQLAVDLGVARERFEFEVLLGVQEPLWKRWKARGYTVRVYVPYGPEWRAYAIRRLQKNPAIAGHVMRALFRRGR